MALNPKLEVINTKLFLWYNRIVDQDVCLKRYLVYLRRILLSAELTDSVGLSLKKSEVKRHLED